MARVEAIPSNCIYKITAGKHCYIGQTTRGTARLDEHIRAAYYENRSDGIYKYMKQHRLMDIEITYYPAPNYGISDFQSA